MPKDRASLTIPGSTSNLGPGYDCLGLALGVSNRVGVCRKEQGDSPQGTHPMVEEAAGAFFRESGLPAFAFSWEIEGEVPISRGLGSSVTLRLGILGGLNELSDCPLDVERLYRICTRLEGHPDNAGPAAFGGFFVGDASGEFFRFEVDPSLKFVLLIPDHKVETANSRQLLPEMVTHRHAVENVGRTARLTAAMATRDYEGLRGSFCDHLHQPFRASTVPGLMEVIAAGEQAGALGGFLSGSGSSIACVALDPHVNSVAEAMRQAHADFNGDGSGANCAEPTRTMILETDNLGMRVSS